MLTSFNCWCCCSQCFILVAFSCCSIVNCSALLQHSDFTATAVLVEKYTKLYIIPVKSSMHPGLISGISEFDVCSFFSASYDKCEIEVLEKESRITTSSYKYSGTSLSEILLRYLPSQKPPLLNGKCFFLCCLYWTRHIVPVYSWL